MALTARWPALSILAVGACLKAPGADFQAKYAGACEKQAAPLPADAAQAGEPWSTTRNQLASKVDDASADLRACYMDALANVPRLQGQIRLQLLVTPGAAPRIGIADNATPSDALACCVMSVVRDATRQLTATSPVGIQYPLSFKLVAMPVGYRYDVGPDFSYARARPEGFELALDGKMYGGADP